MPEIKEKSGGFEVIVFDKKMPLKTEQDTPQDTPQEGLTALEIKILKELKANKNISRKYLSKKLEIGEDTVKEYLKKLRTKGIIKRVGKTSAGHWQIKSN